MVPSQHEGIVGGAAMKRTLLWLAVLLAGPSVLIGSATVADALERGAFGSRSTEVIGSRPLLVIWIREPDNVPGDEIAKYGGYFSDLVFGPNASGTAPGEERLRFRPSVAGYYREVSDGKFSWSRAGLIGPLTASIRGKQPNEIARLALESAAAQGSFNFKQFDANGDGHVSPDELAVLIIVNEGANRHWQDFTAVGVDFTIPGQDVTFAGRVAMAGEHDNLSAFNRELFRIIAPDAVDLDGWPQKCFALNRGLTLMAATNSPNLRETVHLDPWHKMLVGWTEPRVYPMDKPGRARLAAQHVWQPADSALKRPILVYDAARGRSEFFLLEYRTPSRLGFDQDFTTSGLVIWHVMLDGAGRVFKAPADRKNCRGEVLPAQTLFVRGAPDWQLGLSRAYIASNGAVALKWMDGTDAGVRLAITEHVATDWAIEVSWTAKALTAMNH
jgi:hypothetical protein